MLLGPSINSLNTAIGSLSPVRPLYSCTFLRVAVRLVPVIIYTQWDGPKGRTLESDRHPNTVQFFFRVVTTRAHCIRKVDIHLPLDYKLPGGRT